MNQVQLIKRAHFKSLRIEFITFFMSMVLYVFAVYFKIEKLELVSTFLIFGVPFVASVNGNWSPKSQGGKFSWDFIYSLPLNKNEQVKLCVDLNIISTILLNYALCLFLGHLTIKDQASLVNLFILSGTAALCAIPMTYASSYYTFRLHLNAKRKMYQSSIKRIEVIRAIRAFGKLSFKAIIFGIIAFSFVSVLELFKVSGAVKYSLIVISIVCFLSILYLYMKKSTINIFHDYKKSYIDPTFKPFKDGLTSLVMASLLVFYLCYDDSPEHRYRNDIVSQLVKNKSYEKLTTMNLDVQKVNKPNSYGYNAYMLAITLGDLKAIKILESKGGKPSKFVESNYRNYKMNAFLLSIYEGHLNITKHLLNQNPELIKSRASKYKLNALHVSVLNCDNNETVDYLISNYAYLLNSKSVNGETALHISAQKGCLTNIVSLSNAGAQRDIKTKNQKLAFDYIRKGRRGDELRNYFKKLDRVPASIDNK